MGLFGKEPTAQEKVNLWKASLRKEEQLELEESKVKKSIKDAAKQGDNESAKILARGLVESRKAKTRMHNSIAQIHSVVMQLQQQIASQRVMGTLQKSTAVMSAMQNLVRLPQLSQTMSALSKEMTKAGIMEEMINDTMEGLDEPEMEEEAEMEVLDEVMSGAAPVATHALPSKEEAVEEEPTEDLEKMRQRLAALDA